jgi:THAP4-like, heme-binding beta-barrel domain
MSTDTPVDLHPQCAPVAWLLGRWEGNGHGDYPTITKFSFRQEVLFAHDGRPFFHYFSRAFLIDQAGNTIQPSAIETGFLRVPAERDLELVLTHATGFAEVWYGHADGTKIELATDAVMRTETAKEYNAGKRLYGLVDGDLLWTHDMAAMGQPMQSHIWARLKRVGRAEGEN